MSSKMDWFVYNKTASNFLPNIIFLAITTFIVFLIGSIFSIVGKIAFIIYVIVLMFDVLRLLVAILLDCAILVNDIIIRYKSKGFATNKPRAKALSWAATALQIVELIMLSWFTYMLSGFFFM